MVVNVKFKLKWKKIIIDNNKTNYSVSNYGDIRNDKTGYILKPIIDKDGYLVINLIVNGKRYRKKIHRLVAENFIHTHEKIRNQVNHKNGIKKCNKSWNLEWVTCKENIIHAYKNNLHKKKYGENNPMHKYSNKTVIKICKLLKEGNSTRDICSLLSLDYNSNKKNINRIKNRKRWTHISKYYL